MKKENKLYMQWWFWVIVGLMFIYAMIAIMPYPDSLEHDLEVCEDELTSWYEYSEAVDDYFIAFDEYCELDPTNTLCEDALLPDN